jgi:hypothetical protein
MASKNILYPLLLFPSQYVEKEKDIICEGGKGRFRR